MSSYTTIWIYSLVSLTLVHSYSSIRKPRELIHPMSRVQQPPFAAATDVHSSSSYDDQLAEPRDYSFNYVVDDGYAGNYQRREETKDGDRVTGSYAVLEPTGALRIVRYIADHHGFRAIVSRKWPKLAVH